MNKTSALTALAIAALAMAAQAVPSGINYQGVLTDSQGQPVTGTRTMSIKLYDAATSGTPLYTEDLGTVSVTDGVFSFEFGTSGTSNAEQSDTVAITDGSASSFQKVLSAASVVAGSVSVSDGTYTWSQSGGSSNDDDFGVAYSTNLRRVTVTYFNGAPTAGRTITATCRTPASGISGALAGDNQPWAEITVDGVAQVPRQKVLTVPFAYSSWHAASVTAAAKDSITEEVRASLNTAYSLLAAVAGGFSGSSRTSSPSVGTQIEYFNESDGLYGTVVSTTSTQSSLGIDVCKQNTWVNVTQGNGFQNPRTFVVNDKVGFVVFETSTGGTPFTTSISYRFDYADGTSSTVSDNRRFGSHRLSNPSPEKTVTSITRTADGNNHGLFFTLREYYRSLSPVEVIVQLNERLAGGTKFFIGHSATVQGPSYSTSYELLSPNNQVVASSDSPLIQATAPLAVSRVKLVAIPAPIADTADPSILRSITITRVD